MRCAAAALQGCWGAAAHRALSHVTLGCAAAQLLQLVGGGPAALARDMRRAVPSTTPTTCTILPGCSAVCQGLFSHSSAHTLDVLLLLLLVLAGACHNTVAPLVFFAYIASFNRDTPEEPPGRHYQAFVTAMWVFDTTCLAGELVGHGGELSQHQSGEGGGGRLPRSIMSPFVICMLCIPFNQCPLAALRRCWCGLAAAVAKGVWAHSSPAFL
jgi:hypothetical protein